MSGRSRVTPNLTNLQHQFLELAEMVDRAMLSAVWSCTRNDLSEAQRALDSHAAIDAHCREVEGYALQVLACQPPLAGSDLRAASAVLLLITELARIGAYAGGMGTLVLRSASLSQQMPPATLIQMSHKARSMLQHAIRAVVRRDAAASMQLCRDDGSVDALHARTVQHLLGIIHQDAAASEWATYQLWIAHNIERMADRSLTIAERAAFIVTGTRAGCCPNRTARPLPDVSNVAIA